MLQKSISIQFNLNHQQTRSLMEILAKDDPTMSDLEEANSLITKLPDLERYLAPLSLASRLQICRAFSQEHVMKGHHLFHKGDFCDKFYVMITGAMEVYNVTKEGETSYKFVLGPGKRLGEQGLITGQPRSMSAKAIENSSLIFLHKPAFKQYLEPSIMAELREQIQFIENYLPHMHSYSNTPKIHLAYSLQIERFRRGNYIARKGQMLDAIYILKSGDCSVVIEDKTKDIETVKLSIGTCIGEECVLLGIPCGSTIKVMSEYAVCYYLPRLGIRKAAPARVLETLRENYEAKISCRQFMKSFAKKPSVDLKSKTIYKLASPVARRKLLKLTTHRSSLCRIKSAESLERWPTIDIAKSRTNLMSAGNKKYNSVSMTQFKCAVLISGLNSPHSSL
mmetsp:Transcript_28811/g.51295  ORF Transcript_28811/g.51295 Transcript_28811/m.51295 type:complete len:394 (-) Transcript_28811:128-1309(-)